MGFYSEYLNKNLSFVQLCAERKRLLQAISEIRGRPVLVFASDITKSDCPISIDYSDILPFSDQLSTIEGKEIDVILETPGGFAEVVEDLVRIIRKRFERMGVIIPGMAKSAGTIFTMAADEILMGESSALGPIDAQIMMGNGKRFSADAFLEGLNTIRKEAEKNKRLDIAYIPILQNISPGEIQHCENAQAFSRTLVTNWLKEYKFKFWEKHSSTGKPVSDYEKKARAETIAKLLCNHGHWLTHGRSVKVDDLNGMRLQILDYSKNKKLNEAITRYFTLLRMSFETKIYKIYETSASQIYRSINATNNQNKIPNPVLLEYLCERCKKKYLIQINLEQHFPPQPGTIIFPQNNILKCDSCNHENNLSEVRLNLEAQANKKIYDD